MTAAVGVVRAAGGVVWRRGDQGVEVLLVHRPHYDDWSFPKGKAEPGEDDRATALREVAEETGLVCELGLELASTSYVDRRDRYKTVRYWAMTPVNGRFEPHAEVDQVRWLPQAEAASLLSYDRDRLVLRSLGRVAPAVLVLRHAAAGDRDAWAGPDHIRPLTAKGQRQAQALVEVLSGYQVDRILSSPYLRCRQSAEPLAAERGLEVTDADGLAEGADRVAVMGLLDELAGDGALLCSHGDVISIILDHLVSDLLPRDGRAAGRGSLPCAKGSVWVIEADGGRYVAARYLPPPAVPVGAAVNPPFGPM